MEKVGAIIQLIGASLAFFFLILILSKKKKNTSDLILSIFLFVYFVTLLLNITDTYNRISGYPYPVLLSISVPLILLHAPLLWLYIKSLTTPKLKFNIYSIFHLLPFCITLVNMMFTYYLLPVDQKVRIDNLSLFQKEYTYPLIVALITFANTLYYTWGISLIQKYRTVVQSYFSETNSIDLRWLSFMVKAALITYLLISLLYTYNYFTGYFHHGTLQSLGYSLGAIYVVVIGFFGLRQTNIFVDPSSVANLDAIANPQITSSTISKADVAFADKLLKFMDESKPFLDSDLTIAKLAYSMNVQTDYLSKILNSNLNMNFYDFVNRYRVEEFKKKCNEPQSFLFTLIGMAYECGFNSKPTFNRVFKNETGLTPGQYYDSIVKQRTEV